MPRPGNFANRLRTMPARIGAFSAFTGILDQVTGFTFGYAVNAVLKASASADTKLTLREDNGDTEDDFFPTGYDENGLGAVLKNAGSQTVAAWLTANSASNAYAKTFADDLGSYPISQTTTTKQPKLSSDGKKLTFDGVDDFLQAAMEVTTQNTTPRTVVFVCKTGNVSAPTNYPTIISVKTPAASQTWKVAINNQTTGPAYSNVTWGSAGAGFGRFNSIDFGCIINDTQYRAGIITFDGVDGTDVSSFSARTDGVAKSVSASGPYGGATLGNHCIGCDGSGAAFPYLGDISLLMFANGKCVVGDELATLESWLALYVASL